MYLDVADPDPEDILLSDIAIALSQTCRWAGHCPMFYSVAEHACMVHDIVMDLGGSRRQRRAALHHDDHEAYIGDLATPVKNAVGAAYREIAQALDGAIAAKFGMQVEDFDDPLVKQADLLALFVEAEKFKPSKGLHWPGRPERVELPPNVTPPMGHDSAHAQRMYRRRARDLA